MVFGCEIIMRRKDWKWSGINISVVSAEWGGNGGLIIIIKLCIAIKGLRLGAAAQMNGNTPCILKSKYRFHLQKCHWNWVSSHRTLSSSLALTNPAEMLELAAMGKSELIFASVSLLLCAIKPWYLIPTMAWVHAHNAYSSTIWTLKSICSKVKHNYSELWAFWQLTIKWSSRWQRMFTHDHDKSMWVALRVA